MKLNKDNLYIGKHSEEAFAVHIEMPDNSRNFLHCEVMPFDSAVMFMHDIDGDFQLDHSNVGVRPDDSYYRIYVKIEDGRGTIHEFHSRKLNLNDAVSELSAIVIDGD